MFIDKQWNLRSINLETTPIFDVYTEVNLYKAFTDILEIGTYLRKNWFVSLLTMSLISLQLSLIKMYYDCHALVIV